MTFIVTMPQICFLVAVLTMCSVSGRGIQNFREEASRERAIGERTDSEHGQGSFLCGQKQIQTSKRDEEAGGLTNHDDYDHLDKILGGSDVTHGDVPWQVNYYNGGLHKCGGAIINEYWVLTTSTCVNHEHDSNPYLVVGDHRLSQNDSGQQRFEIRWIITNEEYNEFAEGTLDTDMALIKIEQRNGRGILFNNYVQPICLPEPGEGPTDGDRLAVSGWGNGTTGRPCVCSTCDSYNTEITV